MTEIIPEQAEREMEMRLLEWVRSWHPDANYDSIEGMSREHLEWLLRIAFAEWEHSALIAALGTTD
jgi:hypothetical protein